MSHDWTRQFADFSAGTQVHDVATDGAGTWVAVAQFGSINISTDNGVTFAYDNSLAGASNVHLRAVAYGNGFWVIVGYDGSNNGYLLYTATDPAGTWTARTISGFGVDALTSVAYGNSIWVACGDGESPGVYGLATTGADPTTGWTQRTVTDAAGHTQVDVSFDFDMKVAYGNGRFVVVGGQNIATSTNGTTWTNYGEINNGGVDDGVLFTGLTSVVYGNGVWMLAGNSASDVVTNNPMQGVAYNDDVTDMWGWTGVDLPDNAPFDLEYGDVFMGIGTGEVYSSSDGLTWANDNSAFFTGEPVFAVETGGGLAYGENGVWVVAGIDGGNDPYIASGAGAYVLQVRSEVDGTLISSVPLAEAPDQMRRTPNGQHVFVKQGNGTLKRYSRAPALEDTVTIADFFPNDDWNTDDQFALYRLEANVLYKYLADGSESWAIDLNAAKGYRAPSRQIAGGNGLQVYTGRSSGIDALADGYVRVVGYIGGAAWETGFSQACLLTIRRSDGVIESTRVFDGDSDDHAQAVAIVGFRECIVIAGAASGTQFEGETLGALRGWLHRDHIGLTGGDGGSGGGGLTIGEDT